MQQMIFACHAILIIHFVLKKIIIKGPYNLYPPPSTTKRQKIKKEELYSESHQVKILSILLSLTREI